MKLKSLVAILILTAQESHTEEMPSPVIKFAKRPFQIYPIDIAAHGKTTANTEVLGKFLNENTRKNETDCKDLFSRVVIMTLETLRLEDENAKLKSENRHLQQKLVLDMFHKLK